jgi:ankyrin repeat protein
MFCPQEAKTVEGDTPLLRAVRQRNAAIVEMLLDKVSINFCHKFFLR